MTRAWASLLSVGVLGAADGWGRAGLRANVSDALVDQVHLIFQYLSDEHRARSGCATNLLAEFFPTAESVGLPHSWMAAFGFEAERSSERGRSSNEDPCARSSQSCRGAELLVAIASQGGSSCGGSDGDAYTVDSRGHSGSLAPHRAPT